jgi:hypothetical protein
MNPHSELLKFPRPPHLRQRFRQRRDHDLPLDRRKKHPPPLSL